MILLTFVIIDFIMNEFHSIQLATLALNSPHLGLMNLQLIISYQSADFLYRFDYFSTYFLAS